METDLIVALVAGGVALCTATFTAVNASWQSRSDRRFKATTDAELERLRHELDATRRQEDRLLEGNAVLDRYRRPLLAAAVQLLRRLENIQHRSFLSYLSGDAQRADIALKSTLYRLAAYFGWREILNRELTYLPFEDAGQTREVLALLDRVRAVLASSRLDNTGGRAHLMLWTDEQAAIGGLMLQGADVSGVLGFETFFDRYDVAFSTWLSRFADDLRAEPARDSARLASTAAALRLLIERLDVDGVYGDSPEHVGGWTPAVAAPAGQSRSTTGY